VAICLALTACLALVACGGGGGLGSDTAPASLDPNSPRLTATNMAFDRNRIEVPANAPFVLVFENADGVSHNVSVYRDAGYQQPVFQGVLFSGPATRWYPVPALAPGTYPFRCDLHANMTGVIVAS
jgi:plastocyanin